MPSFQDIQEEIGNMLAVPDDQLDEEQQAAMAEYLDMLATQESSKVDGFGSFIAIQQGYIEACEMEAKRLAAKAKTMKSRIDYLKGRYLGIMQEHGVKKIQGNAYTISIRETDKVVVPSDEAFLQKLAKEHPALVRHKESWEPNRVEIKAMLKAGVELPECELVKSASLQVR